MKTVFEERYKRLNKAQKEAVDTIEGPVMVIAGPGTGKTSILTLRIANILKTTDTPASAILAITFTEAGVKAMRMKLREVIGTKADEVRIHTFHGFASSVINEFPEHFSHISRSKQITDIEAESIIRTILEDKKFTKLRPFGNPELYLGPILRTVADSKKEAWTPLMLRSFTKEEIKRIRSDEDNISTRGQSKGKLKAEAEKRIERCEKTALFSDVYEAYETKKKEKKYIDFDDLIIELLLAMERDELLLRLVQEKFLYLLVDEHQDTNDSQNLLVKMIASFFEEPNLFVVGDEKQAVYRFQGASVENFLTFQNIWKSMKVISLTDNYRSHQSILDAGFSLIENNYNEREHESLRVKLLSDSSVKEKPIEHIVSGNEEAMNTCIVKKLKEILKSDTDATVAIITRTNRDIEKMLSLLEVEGIEASAERGTDIFSHPLGSIFFDLIEFLSDRSKVELLARTLSVGLWNVSFEKSVELIRALKSGGTHVLPKELPILRELFDEMSQMGPIEYLICVGTASGFVDKALKNTLSSEVWRTIVSLAQDIAKKDSIRDPKVLFSALLSYRASAETKTIKIAGGKSDANISIMTAHGSKGLEYDFVFVPYANEESWMPRARSSFFVLPKERGEGDDVKDARRLFYVALTRAKLHVVLLSTLSDSLGRTLSPLRFISEIDQSKIKIAEVPAEKETPRGKKRTRDFKEHVEYAKHSLIERGLSVTALNHFSLCPNLFFYKSMLRVPEPPSASSEKGNAMHEAISRVWQSKERGEKVITETLIHGIEDYFRTSLLRTFEKEALCEELVEDAPKVAKALVSHFSIIGDIHVEKLEVMPFRMQYKGKEIELSLHGRLDSVIETEDTVYVFDYKTRSAMSVSAIRGETKNDDGGYFRQLIYYKMILSKNPKYKGKKILPALVFVKPDEKGRCPIVSIEISDMDIKRVESEVENLIRLVWEGNILDTECDDEDCNGCSLLETSRQ